MEIHVCYRDRRKNSECANGQAFRDPVIIEFLVRELVGIFIHTERFGSRQPIGHVADAMYDHLTDSIWVRILIKVSSVAHQILQNELTRIEWREKMNVFHLPDHPKQIGKVNHVKVCSAVLK